MYGWEHDYILTLSTRLFFLYLEQAAKIEAAQQLFNIEAASYPNMTTSSRRKITRHYNRIVAPPEPPTKKEREASWDILKARAPSKAKVKLHGS